MSTAIAPYEIIEAKPGKIGAEVKGLDLNELDAQSPEWEKLRQVIYRNKVLVFRNQDFNEERYVAFARKIGRPQVYFQPQYHHPDYPEIFVSSNVPDENGNKIGISGTGRYWHTDCAFEKKPLTFTSVYPLLFPKMGRETSYIDMHQIYLNLPKHLKDIVENASFIHEGQMRYKVQASDIDKSLRELLDRINEQVPPVQHPAVITHPVTGEKSLYVSSGFTTKMVGLSYEENQKIMRELFDFIEQPQHTHTHYWEEGDLIIWDNRSLIHRASTVKSGEPSKMYRVGIYDNLPFYVGLEA